MNIEFFKIFFKELWHSQPNTVLGAGAAIVIFLIIYISKYTLIIFLTACTLVMDIRLDIMQD